MTDTAATPANAEVMSQAQEADMAARMAAYGAANRFFSKLMVGQLVVAVVAAAFLAPDHAVGILVAGMVLTAGVTFAVMRWPRHSLTPFLVAAGQMLMSGVLILATGGRVETHFHVFVSLALIAFYRDWRVLLTGAVLAVLAPLLGATEGWGMVEHVAWVGFATGCLSYWGHRERQLQWEAAWQCAELEQRSTEAERASRAKDDFLAVLSHELRTPLTPSLMTLSAMTEDETLSEEARRDLALVQRNVDLEARLVDDLLDLTRITRGKLQLTMGFVDLHALLEGLLDTCRNELVGKKLQVKRELTAERCWVYGDSARLQQVFWNLLRNAVKFTPANGTITFRTADAGDRLRIDVMDTGRGIAPEVLPRIFDRFEQGGTAVTRQFGGLGLGLSICKAIVELHHGQVRAESRGTGWGATFTVVLPARVQPSGMVKGGTQTQLLRLSGKLPRRVLLVDDHLDTRETLGRLMTKAGYDVTMADSRTSAEEKASEAEFDLLVSDIGLPDGSGCDLMRVMKEQYGLKGVAFSGFGMEEDVRQSLEAGFYAHLTKPVDFDRLKEVMRRALTDEKVGLPT